MLVDIQRYQFNKSLVEKYQPDVAYIFLMLRSTTFLFTECRYYMQTVVPCKCLQLMILFAALSCFQDFDSEPDDNAQTFANFHNRVSHP